MPTAVQRKYNEFNYLTMRQIFHCKCIRWNIFLFSRETERERERERVIFEIYEMILQYLDIKLDSDSQLHSELDPIPWHPAAEFQVKFWTCSIVVGRVHTKRPTRRYSYHRVYAMSLTHIVDEVSVQAGNRPGITGGRRGWNRDSGQ